MIIAFLSISNMFQKSVNFSFGLFLTIFCHQKIYSGKKRAFSEENQRLFFEDQNIQKKSLSRKKDKKKISFTNYLLENINTMVEKEKINIRKTLEKEFSQEKDLLKQGRERLKKIRYLLEEDFVKEKNLVIQKIEEDMESEKKKLKAQWDQLTQQLSLQAEKDEILEINQLNKEAEEELTTEKKTLQKEMTKELDKKREELKKEMKKEKDQARNKLMLEIKEKFEEERDRLKKEMKEKLEKEKQELVTTIEEKLKEEKNLLKQQTIDIDRKKNELKKIVTEELEKEKKQFIEEKIETLEKEKNDCRGEIEVIKEKLIMEKQKKEKLDKEKNDYKKEIEVIKERLGMEEEKRKTLEKERNDLGLQFNKMKKNFDDTTKELKEQKREMDKEFKKKLWGSTGELLAERMKKKITYHLQFSEYNGYTFYYADIDKKEKITEIQYLLRFRFFALIDNIKKLDKNIEKSVKSRLEELYKNKDK